MKYHPQLEELVSSEDWHLGDPIENQKIANQILGNNRHGAVEKVLEIYDFLYPI